MPKKKSKVFRQFEVPIFESIVFVVLGTPDEVLDFFEVECLIGREDWEEPFNSSMEAGCYTLKNEENRVYWTLAFSKGETRKQTVCHECVHLAKKIFNVESTPVNDDTEEMFCLLVGYLAEQVYRLLDDLSKTTQS